jgi:hypothetical protein
MDLLTIKEVKQAYTVDELNELLQKDWQLIDMNYITADDGKTILVYTVGKLSGTETLTK